MSKLINNRTDLEEILSILQTKSTPSGVELPELVNEGAAADLMMDKQLIDSNGNIVVGTFTIDNELTTQNDLIAQIQTALQGKAAGEGESGGNIEAVTGTVIEDGPCMEFVGAIYYMSADGTYVADSTSYNMAAGESLKVMKNSLLILSSSRLTGNVTHLPVITGSAKYYGINGDFSIVANM